jgi:PHD/YefM family antitoxin component YafN of YafNO toxin-antitoxin module
VRTVSKAEAEQDFAAVLNVAAQEPVRIQLAGQDVILMAAAEFEEAERLLHGRRLHAAAEAKANGFTEEMLPELLAAQ